MLNSLQTDKLISTAEQLAKLQAQEANQRDNPPAPALGEVELARLDHMTRDELMGLVRRLSCQCGLVAIMTKEETAQAMRDVLAETALKPILPGLNAKADIQARLTAIDKWLDRDEGKPMQRQMIAAQVEMHSESLTAQADREAQRMIQLVMDRRKQ